MKKRITSEEKESMEDILYDIAEDVDNWETDTTDVGSIQYEEDQDERMLKYFNSEYTRETRGNQFMAADYLDSDDMEE